MEPLNQSEVDQAYHSIVSQDEHFITMLAKAAIENAIETKTDMWRGSGQPVPDDNDIREFAVSFTDDMLIDFRTTLLERIKEIRFNSNIEQVLISNLKFDV